MLKIFRLIVLIILFNALNAFAGTHSPWYGWRPSHVSNLFSSPDTACAAEAAYSSNPAANFIVTCGPGLQTTLPDQYVFDKFINGSPTGTRFSVNREWRCANEQTANLVSGPTGVCQDTCVVGTHFNTTSLTCVSDVPSLASRDTPDPSACVTHHPIAFTTGDKVLRETDYLGLGVNALTFGRTYNSTSLVSFDNLGNQWRNGQSRSIAIIGGVAYVYRAGGKIYTYNSVAGIWKPNADITDKLTQIMDTGGNLAGWKYTVDATSEVETYNANGKLLSISNSADLSQIMSYSCDTISINCPTVTPSTIAYSGGLLIRVTDILGRNLNFTYDTKNRIKTMTNPAGGVYIFTYDANSPGISKLSSVTYPDGKTKTYLYGEAGNVSATPNAGVSYTNSLTGIIDENNNRYANYFYDAAGRANAEYLAGNVDTANLIYNTDASGNPTSTNVTDARGSTRTYNFTTILGVVKSTGQSQPGGSGCAAASSAITYDANGNVASRNDFDGHRTTYAYDLTRNLETSRTEGLTSAGAVTPATRTITTTWHPTWRLPLVTTEYTGGTTNLADGSGTPTGTALHKTTNVYDSKGNITSITETDPVRSLNRITTITYTYSTAVPGLVLTKVINGPRTDVTDTTTYQYYPHDATCTPSAAAPIVDPITGIAPANLGCRGQVNTITNALGQVTTYNRYNHHGQVEQMTDANGLVTSYTYDLRQRLLSKTVSGAGVPSQSTNLTYDNAGQVTQLKMADNSTLNYTYDAAHRLTDIQDTLGNTIHYTLDASGNRTTEDTKDPLGNLAKTITRSYDALNRLQQVTGVE